MAGYWRDEAATADAFAGGWFHSGDLVRVDEEGFVYVVDRAKDMIISGGENIYCAEVESALAAHPAIREVSVVGRPHQRWGETPVAVVALREPGAELPVAELRAWAGERLASYKLPTAVQRRGRAAPQRQRQGRQGGPAAAGRAVGQRPGGRVSHPRAGRCC